MDTINTLLSLVKLRMQNSEVREWRQQAPIFVQLLRSVNMQDAQLLSRQMLASYPLKDEGERDILNLLVQLNMFVPGALTPVLSILATQQHFYPGQLYLNAGQEICQQLLSLLHGSSDLNWNDFLQALAWIGNEQVQAQFHSWRLSPPDWRTDLYIPPESYSLVAGWELTEDGKRRDLYFSTCFELIASEQAASSEMKLKDKTIAQQHCGWCQRPLQRMLDLNLRDPRCRWISAEGERLCIVVCSRCSYYETIYLDITLAGEAYWSHLNGQMPALLHKIHDDGEIEELPEPLVPGMARNTPFEAVGRFMLDEKGISQLGGHPEWIQDAVYPQCPACQQTMPCLGQVAFTDWEDDSEGCYYFFLCLPCKKAATHYQQT